jgi:RNA polymerase sigma-70 factor, ECF subfamily
MVARKARGSAPDSMVTPTDAALVIAARAGDPRAREDLCRRHMRLVVGLAQRILAGREAADDVVQDAFVEAFQGLDRLQNPQAFSSWLCSIVVRRAGKYLRRARLLTRLGLRSTLDVDPNSLIGQNAPADVIHELRAVYSIIAGLPPEERVALVLRRVDGMELQEIATHMGLSLATIKRRLSAAEARLERALSGARS